MVNKTQQQLIYLLSGNNRKIDDMGKELGELFRGEILFDKKTKTFIDIVNNNVQITPTTLITKIKYYLSIYNKISKDEHFNNIYNNMTEWTANIILRNKSFCNKLIGRGI